MGGEEKRRSERVIPVVSEEEVVLIDSGVGNRILAKMLDFSDGGTLVYLLVDAHISSNVGDTCSLMLYHQGKVFQVPATVLRKSGRLIGFTFGDLSSSARHHIQAKLIRMEIEWTRLKQHTK